MDLFLPPTWDVEDIERGFLITGLSLKGSMREEGEGEGEREREVLSSSLRRNNGRVCGRVPTTECCCTLEYAQHGSRTCMHVREEGGYYVE